MSAPNPVFDRPFQEAVTALLSGAHRRDSPPRDGGRWPVSVIARPPPSVRAELEGLMAEALRHVGPGPFRTGRRDSVHITIRALEPFRAAATAGDPIVADWERALRATAAATRPFPLRFTGITLSSGGVLAQLEPQDARPWQLLDTFRSQLGALAWFEDQWVPRNIWYCSLLHFTTDVLDPAGLIHWAAALRERPPISFDVTALELVRFRHAAVGEQGHVMRPDSWLEVPLTGS